MYRQLLSLNTSEQQWKRISGFALERAIIDVYYPRLAPHQIRTRILNIRETIEALKSLDLFGKVKPNKIDIFIEGLVKKTWTVWGAMHVKSSIAERIQDDVPASKAFMDKGLLSIILTMDSKSFPPPHGDGINYGELGGRGMENDKDRPKRAYIEEDGQFDALFSFNTRTPPSPKITPSGKQIYTLSLNEKQPDIIVSYLTKKWLSFRNSLNK